MTRLARDKQFNTQAYTRYTQKLGVSIGIAPSFLGNMTVVKVQIYPTERLRLMNARHNMTLESVAFKQTAG
jgi:hypothetical protein